MDYRKKAVHRLCLHKMSNRLLTNLYNTLGIFLGHGLLNICHPPFSSAYKLSSVYVYYLSPLMLLYVFFCARFTPPRDSLGLTLSISSSANAQ